MFQQPTSDSNDANFWRKVNPMISEKSVADAPTWLEVKGAVTDSSLVAHKIAKFYHKKMTYT